MRVFGPMAAWLARSLAAGPAGVIGLCLAAGAAHAVPVLQVGAPGGPGEGTYADYGNGTDPTEDDTAFTTGGTIYVAGLYQNGNVQNLGGQFDAGANWSSFGLPGAFDAHDAVLLVSVPDGTLATALGSLTVNGVFAFFSSEDQSYFPNNHAPVKDDIADFLFFDIGEFAELIDVPDFDDETVGNKKGEIKTLLLGGFAGLGWLHFDAMALQTSSKGTDLVTTLENNPGSHDVTSKPPGTFQEVAEPGTLSLLGAGLTALGLVAWRRARRVEVEASRA